MSRALIAVLVLASCAKPPPKDPFADRRRSTLPPPSSSAESAGGGMGSERDRAPREDFGTFRVKEETWFSVGRHDTFTIYRNPTDEQRQELDRLVQKGTVRRLPAGTLVRRLRVQTLIIDGNTVDLTRVELVDDPEAHGNVLSSALEPVR